MTAMAVVRRFPGIGMLGAPDSLVSFHDGFGIRQSRPAAAGKNPPSPPFNKGGLGGFENYLLTNDPFLFWLSEKGSSSRRIRLGGNLWL
jgi:hypothetical protein